MVTVDEANDFERISFRTPNLLPDEDFRVLTSTGNPIIPIENLFQAWDEFRRGKRKRKDVQVFERNLEDNLFNLHQVLKEKTYKHGQYQSFYVHDPKLRHIHKAEVSGRIIHH